MRNWFETQKLKSKQIGNSLNVNIVENNGTNCNQITDNYSEIYNLQVIN